MKFTDFKVGDYTVFEKSFSQQDYLEFAKLSGDYNLLHNNDSYAEKTQFGKKIVPVHLSTLTFSAIAGMCFPGLPSLYLHCEFDAVNPIFYNDNITYSAKISQINPTERILVLSVLVFQKTEIYIKAKLHIQCLADEWEEKRTYNIQKNENKTALITGANGGIGSAICKTLAQAGWDLILLVRKNSPQLQDQLKIYQRYSSKVAYHLIDFCDEETTVGEKLKNINIESATLVIHTASAPVDAPIDKLVKTNYTALNLIKNKVLPRMIERQSGKFIFIGTTSTHTQPIGWENYSCSKWMTNGLINYIEKNYSQYGIRALTLAPHVTKTKFTDQYVDDRRPKLLPSDIASKIQDMLTPNYNSTHTSLYLERETHDKFFITEQAPKTNPKDTRKSCQEKNLTENPIKSSILSSIMHILAIDDVNIIKNGGLGITPGWDSLKQIQIILALEEQLNVTVPSNKIQTLSNYQSIKNFYDTYLKTEAI